jgi:hypothetical protein
MFGLNRAGLRRAGSTSLVSESEKPGLRIDFMELRRLGFVLCFELVSVIEGPSVDEKDRFREGDRKEFGDKDGRRWEGEG